MHRKHETYQVRLSFLNAGIMVVLNVAPGSSQKSACFQQILPHLSRYLGYLGGHLSLVSCSCPLSTETSPCAMTFTGSPSPNPLYTTEHFVLIPPPKLLKRSKQVLHLQVAGALHWSRKALLDQFRKSSTR